MHYIVQDNFSVFSICRFTDEEKAKRPQFCYCPFGSGPCNCIGMRFVFLEAKIALIELMKKFTFIKAPETEVIFFSVSLLCLFICGHSCVVLFICRYLWKQCLVLLCIQRMEYT